MINRIDYAFYFLLLSTLAISFFFPYKPLLIVASLLAVLLTVGMETLLKSSIYFLAVLILNTFLYIVFYHLDLDIFLSRDFYYQTLRKTVIIAINLPLIFLVFSRFKQNSKLDLDTVESIAWLSVILVIVGYFIPSINYINVLETGRFYSFLAPLALLIFTFHPSKMVVLVSAVLVILASQSRLYGLTFILFSLYYIVFSNSIKLQNRVINLSGVLAIIFIFLNSIRYIDILKVDNRMSELMSVISYYSSHMFSILIGKPFGIPYREPVENYEFGMPLYINSAYDIHSSVVGLVLFLGIPLTFFIVYHLVNSKVNKKLLFFMFIISIGAGEIWLSPLSTIFWLGILYSLKK